MKKGLYGMKQGGQLWNRTMDSFMKELGFTQLSVEHCIYHRKRTSGTILQLYMLTTSQTLLVPFRRS